MKLTALIMSIFALVLGTTLSFATVMATAPVEHFRSVQGAVEFTPGFIPAGLTQTGADIGEAGACPVPPDGEPASLSEMRAYLEGLGFTIIETPLNEFAADPDLVALYGELPINIVISDIQLIMADPRAHPELIKIYVHGYSGGSLCYSGTMEFYPHELIEGLDGLDNPNFPAKAN